MKTMLGRIIPLITTLVSVLPAAAQPVTMKTSDTLLGLARQWAEAYQGKRADSRIQVTGGETTAAFSALAEHKVNIITVSRAIRYQETEACEAAFGKPPVGGKVGVSAAAVYVHTNNLVTVLTYDELYGIFRGRYSNWKELGGQDAVIAVYGQETNTAAGELFVEEVLNGKALTNSVRLLAGAELLQAIKRDPNGIGFGAFAPGDGIRTLSIKRVFSSTPVEPSEETISNRIYPISRFLYAYLDPAANQGETKAYLDWIRGEEGQQTARQAGYYPLPPKWRVSP